MPIVKLNELIVYNYLCLIQYFLAEIEWLLNGEAMFDGLIG